MALLEHKHTIKIDYPDSTAQLIENLLLLNLINSLQYNLKMVSNLFYICHILFILQSNPAFTLKSYTGDKVS